MNDFLFAALSAMVGIAVYHIIEHAYYDLKGRWEDHVALKEQQAFEEYLEILARSVKETKKPITRSK